MDQIGPWHLTGVKMNSEFVGYIHAESPLSVLFHGHFWHSPIWLPKSQIQVLMYNPWESTEVRVRVKDWLCRRKSLGEFEEVCDA